jgi:hypothetical protein
MTNQYKVEEQKKMKKGRKTTGTNTKNGERKRIEV